MLRLWLNNEEAELKPDETIATTLQVNDVEKPESFQSSFTNTFDLPLTRVNRRILGNAQANGDNNTLRTKIPARLENSGFSIVSNGFAVVNEINNNTAKITVYDGVADFFTEIGDRKLKELDLSGLATDWDLTNVTSNTQNTWNDGFIWALANYGDVESSTTVFDIRNQYPSLFVKYLFQEIASQFTSYSFANDGLYVDSFFENLVVPFTNNDDNWNNFNAVIDNGTTVYNMNITYKIILYTIELYNEGIFTLTNGEGDYTGNAVPIKVTSEVTGDLFKSGSGTVSITVDIIGESGTIYATNTLNTTSGGSKTVVATSSLQVISEKIFTQVTFNFSVLGVENFTITDVTFASFVPEAFKNFGDSFEMIVATPDMNIKDFVKDIWKIFGIVPEVDTYRKTINMRFFEVFSTDISNAIDYTSEVDVSKGIEQEYQYGEYAITNELKWNEDNLNAPFFANGSFNIDNALLDLSYDWIELEFAPIESIQTAGGALNMGVLPVLDDNNDLSTALNPRLGYVRRYNGIRPNIDFTDGTSTNTNVVFSTVLFADSEDSKNLGYLSLRENYHDSLIKMVSKMNKVTIYLNLNSVKFTKLDFFKPVYLSFSYKLGQISGMFLIQKVEDYEAGKAAKTELVKLNPF